MWLELDFWKIEVILFSFLIKVRNCVIRNSTLSSGRLNIKNVCSWNKILHGSKNLQTAQTTGIVLALSKNLV